MSGIITDNQGRSSGLVKAVAAGRKGTVDWQTSIKTSTVTVVDGEGYFVNTSGGAVTANLPAGSAGAIAAFRDYANTFDSNALTINSNGSEKINGETIDLVVNTEGESLTLVYADATKGWLVVNDGNNDAGSQEAFITATGGTITTVCTNYKVHTFTGPGTFTVCSVGNAAGSNTVDYLVVAGGGGGGNNYGGGGGGGGYRESPGTASGSYTVSPRGASPAVALPVSATDYPITIGGGGAAAASPGCNQGASGSNSVFSSITSAGGGAGAGAGNVGVAGGSGGGGQGPCTGATPGRAGGAGNTPPVSPAQGTAGVTVTAPQWAGAGGGATAAGAIRVGGAGGTSSINATPTGRSGGGAGGPEAGTVPQPGAATASDGGGGYNAAGTANTGGGGGSDTGAGGSGIVIIRYKFQ